MDVWGWIVVYALGLTILQLLLYRYLVGGSGTPVDRGANVEREGSPPFESENDDRGDRDSRGDVDPRVRALLGRSEPGPWGEQPDRASEEPGVRTCPHCGAENEPDPVFSRCWSCTGQL
jgi:hypothetical protein